MGYARTKPTVYVVHWPQIRVVKVGFSAERRWRSFEIRGADVVGLMEFSDAGEAFDFEYACHMGLQNVCRKAFLSSQDAVPYLGNGGGGYLECYVLPADLMHSEILTFIDYQLADVHADR